MSSRGGHDTARQSERPARGRRNQFPPPKAVPDYMTRKLPALPPKPPSTSSSLDISEEESYRPSPSRFYRGRELQQTHHYRGRSSSGIVEVGDYLNKYAIVMAPSPKISIVTDFEQANRSFGSEQQEEVILSPQPRHPIHQILKDMDIHDEPEVSPGMSAPPLTLSSRTLEVSPLTPEDTMVCDFGRAVSEPDPDAQFWAIDTGKDWIQDPHEEDMPPAAPLPSLGFFLVPVKKAKKKPAPRIQPLRFRHSDPCSPVETFSGSAREFSLAAPKPQLNIITNFSKVSRPRSENTKATTGKPTPEIGEYRAAGHHSPWQREYGQKRVTPESSSSSGISFAVREIPSFSTRPRGNRKPKPKPLQINNCKRAEEYVKTPYPWEDKQLGMENPSGSMRESTPTTGEKTTEASRKSRRVSKLVSRVKHASGEVISRLSFTSEESRRAKRAEELRGKIQHLGAQSVQKNMF